MNNFFVQPIKFERVDELPYEGSSSFQLAFRHNYFSFRDLVTLCREPFAYDPQSANDPLVIDSHMNHVLAGQIIPLTVVVIPMQLLPDTLAMVNYLNCKEQVNVFADNPKDFRDLHKTTDGRNRVLFVVNEYVKALGKLLKQKVTKKPNRVYKDTINQLLGKEVETDSLDRINKIMSYCGSLTRLNQLLKEKRSQVTGFIPQKTVYVSPAALSKNYIYAAQYVAVNIEVCTDMYPPKSKIKETVAVDCLRHELPLQRVQNECTVLRQGAIVHSQPFAFMTVQRSKLLLYQLIDCLKKHNTIFIPVNDLYQYIQSESDRQDLIVTHMQVVETGHIPQQLNRTILPNRTDDCIANDCPICFQTYFGESATNPAPEIICYNSQNGLYPFCYNVLLPVFYRCCYKTICYKCFMNYVRNQDNRIQCPMCRSDIEINVIRRFMIVPVPNYLPSYLAAAIGSYVHKPRIIEAIIYTLARLLSTNNRIALLPTSQSLKEDVEQAIEFLMLMHYMRDVGNVSVMFQSAFGLPLPSISSFIAFNDSSFLSRHAHFFYIAGHRGISRLDLPYLDGFVVFSTNDLKRVVCMASNSLFGVTCDLSSRIALVDIFYRDVKCFEIESAR